jgi:hypothetical protein
MLAKMTPADQSKAVGDLVRAAKAKPNGAVQELNGEIRDLEARYQMTTAEMRAKFKARQIGDTADVATWLMLARLRDRLSQL